MIALSCSRSVDFYSVFAASSGPGWSPGVLPWRAADIPSSRPAEPDDPVEPDHPDEPAHPDDPDFPPNDVPPKIDVPPPDVFPVPVREPPVMQKPPRRGEIEQPERHTLHYSVIDSPQCSTA